MNIIKKTILFVIDCWRVVMDNRYNPLRHIKDPSIQFYFTMALFVMWSGYFSVIAWVWIGWESYSIVASIWIHLSVIIPIMITNLVFREAENNNARWVRHWRDNGKR